MNNESKDILEGFNAGYILRQKQPELYEQLQKAFIEVDEPFFKSFIEGGKEYEQEHIRELMSKDISLGSNKKDSPNKDYIEPDINI